jgi:hypothetical protein
MADLKSSAAALTALALAASACDRLPQRFHGRGAPSSVTVKLPPARPATPAPGFAFDAPQAAAQGGASLNSG